MPVSEIQKQVQEYVESQCHGNAKVIHSKQEQSYNELGFMMVPCNGQPVLRFMKLHNKCCSGRMGVAAFLGFSEPRQTSVSEPFPLQLCPTGP